MRSTRALTPEEWAHLLDLRRRVHRGWERAPQMRHRCLAAIDFMLWTDYGAASYREALRTGRLSMLLPPPCGRSESDEPVREVEADLPSEYPGTVDRAPRSSW